MRCLFAARIVVGHDRDVSLLDRNATHDRALALVAIAAAAEHRNQPARRERPAGIERRGKRLGLMRIVDDGEPAVSFPDDLEPAGHAL